MDEEILQFLDSGTYIAAFEIWAEPERAVCVGAELRNCVSYVSVFRLDGLDNAVRAINQSTAAGRRVTSLQRASAAMSQVLRGILGESSGVAVLFVGFGVADISDHCPQSD